MPIVTFRISLPPVYADDGRKLSIKPIDLPLYPAQATNEIFEGKTELTATSFDIINRGLVLTLPKGRYIFRPERFDEAVEASGIVLPLTGASAVIGLAALHVAFGRLVRRRGERSIDRAKEPMLDSLYADVLVRLSRGTSWRASARESLDAHAAEFSDLPGEEALIKVVQRRVAASKKRRRA
jgi:hypothetical protein